jgi:hypothetical protein
MSKKHRQHNGKSGNGSQPQVSSAELGNRINQLSEEALKDATEEEMNNVVSNPVPESVDLQSVWRTADQARQLFNAQKERALRREQVAEEKERAAEQRTHKVSQREDAVRAEEQKLSADKKAFEERNQTLLAREEAITKRELDAEAGFIELRRKSLESLNAEAQALRDERQATDERIRKARSDWESDLERREQQYREQLEKKGEELKQKEVELNARAARILLDEDTNKEIRRGLEEVANARAAEKVQRAENARASAEARLKLTLEDRDRLEAALAKRDEAERKFGNRKPEEVLQDLKTLAQKLDEANQKLATRPTDQTIAQLDQLIGQKESWEAEKITKEKTISSLNNRLATLQVAVNEVEALRNERDSLLSSKQLLLAALEELRKDVDERVKQAAANSAFPALIAMDSDSELLTEKQYDKADLDLKRLVTETRNRIARPVQKDAVPLYYSDADLRCFLGGLAMSKLLLLQGISGTGKTSLPIAVARAMGADITVVSVQAGWRDREDLLGHFNSFERKYYESEFLKALYRSQLPCNREGLNFILLDEMNLSHPEQYFADLLSQLELSEDRRAISLMTVGVASPPKLFMQARMLSLPPNIWFTGTANHDETTVAFADKTYDRAHVMELPRNRERFQAPVEPARRPISYSALMRSFENAGRHHEVEVRKAIDFMNDHADLLERYFRIGWGNRLEKQASLFVPVILKAGGSLAESVDHLFESKVLRKLKGRHDNRPEDLKRIQTKLSETWGHLGTGGPEVQRSKSWRLVEDELRRVQLDASDA